MNVSLHIQVYQDRELVYEADLACPLELGRQSGPGEALHCKICQDGRWRVAIAPLGEDTIPRRVLLEMLPEQQLRLTNLSDRLAIRVEPGGRVKPGASCQTALPALLILGRMTIRVQSNTEAEVEVQALDEPTAPPGHLSGAVSRFPGLDARTTIGTDTESFISWLRGALDVLQSASNSLDFFPKAAQAMVDMVGLDCGRVLMLEGEDWKVRAVQTSPQTGDESDWQPSRHVLDRIRGERRTFWQVPSQAELEGASLVGVQAVVAAPILNCQGEVIGVLYGDRRQANQTAAFFPLTKMEAMLVELLACEVATGLARLEQEEAALRTRVQFEQFFSVELVRELERTPNLLEGQEREVTVLCSDLRGFSSLSERLGAERTCRLVRDMMERLSGRILDEGGVIVDYAGDGILAMWNAPTEQADHATRACRAALAMLAEMPGLNATWEAVVGKPLVLGIGVNTGTAQVGNTGSSRKLKYGPLGNTVNLTSRIQEATKYLRARLLVTQATHARLDSGFEARRLGKVRVMNIEQPVELYELAVPGDPRWPALKAGYETTLRDFEDGHIRAAARGLGNLLVAYPDDGPSLVLMSRAINTLVDEPAHFDGVWQLPGK